MSKKIYAKDLVLKIERLTKERMLENDVVSLDQFRQLKDKTAAPSILVIDDDASIRASLKKLFEREKYLVALAADATELAKTIDESSIDLIILDIGLPWINGFELAVLMKENKDLKGIPLIFLSAQASELDLKRAFEVGASDYVKKPFDVEELKKTVRSLLALNT